MHVVSIANFILLASSVNLCALRPTTLASRLKARNYRIYAFRLAFHANVFARIQERQTGANLSRRW